MLTYRFTPTKKKHKQFLDDVDILLRDHGNVFPEDWDSDDIVNFCCRYVISYIGDIEEFFHDEKEG